MDIGFGGSGKCGVVMVLLRRRFRLGSPGV